LINKDDHVRFRRPVTIDLGGIAKGFAVDRAVEALQKAGAISGIVNAGGDLRVFGEHAQEVQIRHPLYPGRTAGMVRLRDRALATSARYFAPALFDGRSRQPLPDEISVTVAARDCLTADALTKIALALRGMQRSCSPATALVPSCSNAISRRAGFPGYEASQFHPAESPSRMVCLRGRRGGFYNRRGLGLVALLGRLT
jgi:hypothetical protein